MECKGIRNRSRRALGDRGISSRRFYVGAGFQSGGVEALLVERDLTCREYVQLFRRDMVKGRSINLEVFREYFLRNVSRPIGQLESRVFAESSVIENLKFRTGNMCLISAIQL